MKIILSLVSMFVLLNACTSKEDRVVAVVNGKQIKVRKLKEDITSENWNKAYIDQYLKKLVEKEVILYEANRLSVSEQELFSFFDALKTREIKGKELEDAFIREFKDIKGLPKAKILDLVRQKQYEKAKLAYIQELINRSTIRIYQDQLDESL